MGGRIKPKTIKPRINRRREHIALHNKAFRYDDLFWNTYLMGGSARVMLRPAVNMARNRTRYRYLLRTRTAIRLLSPVLTGANATRQGDITWVGKRRRRQRGTLKDSLDYETFGNGSVIFGSNRVYAGIHQRCGQAGPGKKITLPARPYPGVPPDFDRRILNDPAFLRLLGAAR